ncbi:hypothetical protein Q4561_17310 [Alteromonas sp. 1_MG-2023]|uniref:hypothetical protein n=1 Tax=Alteromonas sp. 1_MG-2023 TaxID=3062669 RepID=UPI0026E1D18E|nr:hypothetical protein [Alteromonas sp. 1_MG-2023]MDO6568834.1 hypothetical protein [Alteromonas sp. 1_MG-2023]
MDKYKNKPRLEESVNGLDLVRMQTEIGLIDSMLKSKALTAIVVVSILLFTGFFYFLYKMATSGI